MDRGKPALQPDGRQSSDDCNHIHVKNLPIQAYRKFTAKQSGMEEKQTKKPTQLGTLYCTHVEVAQIKAKKTIFRKTEK